jgi:hypothetical protein
VRPLRRDADAVGGPGRRRFGAAGVAEPTYQIRVENMRARMNSALGITEQGFGSGEICRVPWTTEAN